MAIEVAPCDTWTWHNGDHFFPGGRNYLGDHFKVISMTIPNLTPSYKWYSILLGYMFQTFEAWLKDKANFFGVGGRVGGENNGNVSKKSFWNIHNIKIFPTRQHIKENIISYAKDMAWGRWCSNSTFHGQHYFLHLW